MVCYSLIMVGALFCAVLISTVDSFSCYPSRHKLAHSNAQYLHRYANVRQNSPRRIMYVRMGLNKQSTPAVEPMLTNTTMIISVVQNIKNLISGKGWNGALTKDSIAKLGLNVLLAYGFVSNVSYITCVIVAWISHGRMYGNSPLAAGQWKAFLLIYSGLFAANNVIRPLRFSLSLVLSPFFDAQISRLRRSLGLSRSQATGLLVFLVNIVGTITYLVVGLMLATKYFEVPLLP